MNSSKRLVSRHAIDIRDQLSRLALRALAPEIADRILCFSPITIFVTVTQQGDEMPQVSLTASKGVDDLPVTNPAHDPQRTVTLSIPELHQALRKYESTQPLPEIKTEDLAKGLASTVSETTGRSLKEVESAIKSTTTRLAEGQAKAEASGAEAVRGKAASNLPPVYDGLVFPRDAGKLRWLGCHHSYVIRCLHKDSIDEAKQIFEDLRHFARDHGTDDFILIECIITWNRLVREPKELIARVKQSIEATQVAEVFKEAADSFPAATKAETPTPCRLGVPKFYERLEDYTREYLLLECMRLLGICPNKMLTPEEQERIISDGLLALRDLAARNGAKNTASKRFDFLLLADEQWEYLVTREFFTQERVNKLNELGKEGWEAVSHIDSESVLMKRRVKS